jgi:hypothetical protein
MTSEACSTCLVKSGLPVKGKYYKVVCSVCGGRGVVSEKAVRPQGHSQLAWLLLASPLLLMAGFLTAMSIEQWRERQDEYEHMGDIVEQRAREMTKETPLADVKEQLLGMSKKMVSTRLGDPESTKRLDTPDGTTEIWEYTRWDGRLKLRIENGVVKEVSSH